jgi:NTP pyrophosphatase (non-canonical NTP hydrolase)
MENNNTLTLAEAQQQVDQWIRTVGVRYFSELTNMAILTEEVGEVARLISRTYGEQSFKAGKEPESIHDELEEEFSDVLFVLICLANQTGVDLEQGFRKAMDKRNTRDQNRHKENPKLQ